MEGLSTVATLSAKTKNQVLDIIEDNAPKPIKDLVLQQPEVIKIGDELFSKNLFGKMGTTSERRSRTESRCLHVG